MTGGRKAWTTTGCCTHQEKVVMGSHPPALHAISKCLCCNAASLTSVSINKKHIRCTIAWIICSACTIMYPCSVSISISLCIIIYIYLYIYPIGSMYAIYGNIYHQYTPNVSIYTIHGSYGYIYIYQCTCISYLDITFSIYPSSMERLWPAMGTSSWRTAPSPQNPFFIQLGWKSQGPRLSKEHHLLKWWVYVGKHQIYIDSCSFTGRI